MTSSGWTQTAPRVCSRGSSLAKDPGRQPGRGRGRGDVHARLQLGEAGTAVLERHDLSVQQQRPAAGGCGERGQFGVGDGDVAAGPGGQPDLPAVDEREGPDAVPLHLERPARIVSGQRARHGHHRGQQRRQPGRPMAARWSLRVRISHRNRRSAYLAAGHPRGPCQDGKPRGPVRSPAFSTGSAERRNP